MANAVKISRVRDLAYVTHKDYEGVVTPGWFDPDAWGAAAELVSSGGRGGAWFVETANLSAVLRKYLRGGFVARISESAYIYLGEDRVARQVVGDQVLAERRLVDRLVVDRLVHLQQDLDVRGLGPAGDLRYEGLDLFEL